MSSYSKAQFEKAVEIVQNLPKDGPIQPTTDDKLYFYRYFKQATIGDVNTTRPGMLDFAGKAKWDAWKEVQGVSAEDAYTFYVQKLLEILEKVQDNESKQHIAAINAA